MTTKSAKVGILFAESKEKEKKEITTKKSSSKKNVQKITPSPIVSQKKPPQNLSTNNKKNNPKAAKTSKKNVQKIISSPTSTITSAWSVDKINYVLKSLLDIISILNIDYGSYIQEVSKNNLHITFKKRFLSNKYREGQFFKNCTYILTALIRNKYKDDSKNNLRLILTCKPD